MKQTESLDGIRLRLHAARKALDSYDSLSAGRQWAVFAVVVLAIFSRRPSLLLHAQFYAEDARFWFPQAYNFGLLRSLVLPQAGYLNTMPRLAAGAALLVPLKWSPLVMAIMGLLVEALPVPILLSSRLRTWAPLSTRCLMAVIYVVLPNTREIQIVATNTQWHLALVMVLLALAASPRTWLGRCFDIVVVLVAAFTGPFCIVLAPIALLFWWLRRQHWTLAIFCLAAGAACLQVTLLLHQPPRAPRALGVRIEPLLRMLGGDVVGGALFGTFAFATKLPLILLAAAAIVGLSIVVYCFRNANLEWKLFLLYCAGVYAASLYSPLVIGDKPLWDLLAGDFSARYWFLPMLAFLWSAVWCATYARIRVFKVTAMGMLVCMPIGVIHDWRYRPFADDHFAIFLDRMQRARPGEHVIFPLQPEGWQIDLIKKNPY